MSKRLDELRMVDPVLTSLVQSYDNQAYISESLFPVVEVTKSKNKIPVFGKEAFYIRDTRRAIRANSNRMPVTDISMIDFETSEKDIEVALDYLEEDETTNLQMYTNRLTKTLRDSIDLSREKEAADLVQDLDNFSADLKLDIGAGDAFDDYTNSTDPIEVIKDAMSDLRKKIAVFPNTMVLGESVYKALMSHPKIIERVKYSGLGKASINVLKELTDITSINVGLAVYTDDDETFSDVWGDNIILAYVSKSKNANEFNPSFAYTFRRKGMPEVDTYNENGGKLRVIRYTDNYTIKITGQDAAFLIANTNHN